MSYNPNSESDLRRALEEGALRIEVDEPRELRSTKGRITFNGDEAFDAETRVRVVHVISKPAGGEIRGYAIVDGELYGRGPYHTDWPALDALVRSTLKERGATA